MDSQTVKMQTDCATIGIDLGSRTTKIVTLDGNQAASFEIFDTDPDPMRKVRQCLGGHVDSRLAVTGYGRHLLEAEFCGQVVSEIKACARGAAFVNPNCRTAVDVGGQDSKVIEVTPGGGFANFEMNDRCAAGTGRFLEVMARVLGYDIEAFWHEALLAESPTAISSMCTVFAESEVISLITSGAERRRVALGLHQATAERLYSLTCKVERRAEIMFVGGVAHNRCIVEALAHKLKCDIVVPDHPQMVSALGAALIARESASTKRDHHKA